MDAARGGIVRHNTLGNNYRDTQKKWRSHVPPSREDSGECGEDLHAFVIAVTYEIMLNDTLD